MLTVDYEKLGLKPGMRVLDLGAGFGRHAFETARRGAHVVATDLAMDEMSATKDTFAAMYLGDEIPAGVSTTVIQANGLDLPFEDNSFDCIIASEILEHVPDDVSVMGELLRVLVPGGRLAATIPAEFPERICWKLNEAYHAPIAVGGHVRIYKKDQLKERLVNNGFLFQQDHRAHALHSPYWWLKCAVGLDNEDNPLVKAYLRFLTWDIVKAPKMTRLADQALNPVLGKSLVVYADKPKTAMPKTAKQS